MGNEATRFKKGNAGNPKGRPPKRKELAKLEAMTKDVFAKKVQEFGWMTQTEFTEKMKNPKTKMIDKVFGRILAEAASGKMEATKILLERLWGKVTEKYELLPAAQDSGKPKVIIELPQNGYEGKGQVIEAELEAK